MPFRTSWARILAEFEMTLERDVLQPLNRAERGDPSTHTFCPQLPSPPPLQPAEPPPPPPTHACPQEELPAILKHKKSLQKLVSDWNTLRAGGSHSL